MFRTVELPPCPGGEADYQYSLTYDGRLLRAHGDKQSVEAWRKGKSVRPGYQGLSLSIFDGSEETDLTFLTSKRPARMEYLPGRRILIEDFASRSDQKNGLIVDSNGAVLNEMGLGHGASHIRAMADGSLWIAYMDEGIFSGGLSAETPPLSRHGLVQLGEAGNRLWAYDQKSEHPIDDCYALSRCGSDVWTCFYSTWPICRIRAGKTRYWNNAVIGATALAIEEPYVVLAGGYGDRNSALSLLCLEGDSAILIGETEFPEIDLSKSHLIQGDANALHVIGDDKWMTTTVSQVAAALGC